MAAPAVTLRQLHYLAELAATGHFRRAAERVGVTQPSLSAQIALLEQALGVKLIERGGTTAVLTPVGREVTDRAQRILADLQALIDSARSDPDGLSGTLRIGVSPTLGPYLMPHIVARLHREHPELKLHVREGTPEDMVRDLAAGLHDVVLAQLPVVGEEYMIHRLFREPLLIAMASDDPLAREAALDPAALAGRSLLTLSPRYKMTDQIIALGEAVGAKVLRDYEGTSLDAIRQMAGMGMGLALLPALYVRSEIREGDEVVTRPLKGRSLHRDLGLVWRKSAGRSPAFYKLAELITEVWKGRAAR
ncbi:MAG: DNA-binding transcriptional regulator OxyR [Caulobacterales bacterium 32-69-10]|nr:MAG: DNA-binding transcriptional regulator OxyR [Caulobacterales bacterium 32-69-10]